MPWTGARSVDSLSVQSTHGQPEPEPSDRAQARFDALSRHLAEEPRPSSANIYRRPSAHMLLPRIRPPSAVIIVIVVVGVVAAPTGCGERVGEYARHVGGRDAAALVADAQGERGGLVDAREARWRHDGDEDGWEGVGVYGAGVLFVVVLDGRAEGVLQYLGENVLHVHGDVAVFFESEERRRRL